MIFPPLALTRRSVTLQSLTRLAGLGLTASLIACSTPGPEVPALSATSAAALQLTASSTPELSSTWWQALGEAQLNALVATALADNPTLLTAQLRVRRMQALSGIAQANGLPQASLGADFTRQRFSANGLYPKPIAGSTRDNDTLQAGVSWSPDLWGQHAAELASAIGQTRAAQADAAVLLIDANEGDLLLGDMTPRDWHPEVPSLAWSPHAVALQAARDDAQADAEYRGAAE